MSSLTRNPYVEPESSTTKWVVIFVLLSLLAHAIIIATILLITLFMPPPKIPLPEPKNPTVHLTLVPPPTATPPKPLFVPTTPQADAQHKKQLVESENDHDLTTKSTVARNPNSIMPDVTGKEHQPNLNQAPNIQSVSKPEVSSTPPTPKQAQPEKPTPPKPPTPPQPEKPPQPKTSPPVPKPTPPKPTPPTPAKPEQQLDANGLPVLPQINAPTMAQVNPQLASPPPTPSLPEEQTSVHGRLGHPGDNSPAAMATALGKYKQKFYRAVGSRWYPKVDNSFQLLGVGEVRIQYTIHSDGTIETKVLDGGNSSTQTLLAISMNSIRETSPFDPFPPEMIKELISQNGGDGSSYTDDFTFSVY